MKKGFLLSLDAMLALAFVAIILSLPLVLSQNSADYQHFNELSQMGRDYLVQKYFLGKNLTPSNFTSLAGNFLSESEPSDSGFAVSSLYYQYPNFLNCTNSASCSFSNSSGNASFLNAQDTGIQHKFVAWVKP